MYGELWRHTLLSAKRWREAGALEPRLQPHVQRWTAGLGAWALKPADAAFMINLSVVRPAPCHRLTDYRGPLLAADRCSSCCAIRRLLYCCGSIDALLSACLPMKPRPPQADV